MPSLLEALSEGFDTVGTKPTSNDFVRKLENYKNAVVNDYMKYNIDLNKSIAKIGKAENLNDDQIQRIIEEVNNQVYLIKYSQMKNSPDRDVKFDLASLPKVKKAAGENSEDTKKEASYKPDASASSMEKKASWDDGAGDKVSMFNYSPYEFAALTPEVQRSKQTIELTKLAKELQSIDGQIENHISKVAESAHTIAHALIQYARHGVDTQGVFDQICKAAQCSVKEQVIIKKALEQKLGFMKEAKQLPEDYELSLDFANIAKEAEFSLKQYSFAKEAEFKNRSNQNLPIVITDDATIHDLNDLVKRINAISDHSTAARTEVQKKNEVIKAAGLTEDQAEKLAAAGNGLVAFGKAITGVGASAARKNLDDAVANLSIKVNSPRLQAAKSEAEALVKSKKNFDVHPRMQEANKVLDEKMSGFDQASRRSDIAKNEAALKPLWNPAHYVSKDKVVTGYHKMIANRDLNLAKNMTKGQASRIHADIDEQIAHAQRKVSNIEREEDIAEAVKAVKDSEKAYGKAVASRKKARGIALAGAGAGVALHEKAKYDKQKSSGIYY